MGRHLPIEPRIPEIQKVDSRVLGVAAMASAYSSSRDTGSYLAGLWQKDLQRQLLWQLDGIDGDLSTMMNKGSSDPRLDDDTYQLYSVGLLLRYEGCGATFSRVGVYVVEEPGPEEADLVYDNKSTRESWLRGCIRRRER